MADAEDHTTTTRPRRRSRPAPSTTPSPVMLPELPDDSVEREVVLRSLAERVARYHGPTTARFLASLLDEAADDLEAEHGTRTREEGSPGAAA
jgi:hypothetical protein